MTPKKKVAIFTKFVESCLDTVLQKNKTKAILKAEGTPISVFIKRKRRIFKRG